MNLPELISREDRLIFYGARIKPDEKVCEAIKKLIGADINWDVLVNKAYNYGVAPLLYKNFCHLKKSVDIPFEVEKKLKIYYFASLTQSIYLYKTLKQILTILQKREIQVIVLKGAILAEAIYGDIGLRPFNDIDLLIKNKDKDMVWEEISNLGYDQLLYSNKYTEKLVKVQTFFNKKNKISIDIHYGLSFIMVPEGIYQFNMEEVWKNAQSFKIDGLDVFMPSTEDHIKFLCLHTKKHLNNDGNINLIKICDIAEIIKTFQTKINWQSLKRDIEHPIIGSAIWDSLYLAWNWFSAPIDNEILTKNLSKVNKREDEYLKLLTGNSEYKIKTINFSYQRIIFKEIKGIKNKINFILESIFTNKEFVKENYPGKHKNYIYVLGFLRLCKVINSVVKNIYKKIISNP